MLTKNENVSFIVEVGKNAKKVEKFVAMLLTINRPFDFVSLKDPENGYSILVQSLAKEDFELLEEMMTHDKQKWVVSVWTGSVPECVAKKFTNVESIVQHY